MLDAAFDPCHSDRLLTVEQMYGADRATIDSGTPGEVLMERAGGTIADTARERFASGRVVVLCGPGNNGGDGFVVARLLHETGWTVEVGLLGDRATLKGDAATMASQWQGPVRALTPGLLDGADLVVDALFGAGLSRDLDGPAADVIEAVIASRKPVIAVDVPSGLDGDTGVVRGVAAPADVTVTFCRAKPGHVLMPGRRLCGDLVVADIGIARDVVGAQTPFQWRNAPALWARAFPWPDVATHKYDRGHTVVAGGGLASTGASRLAARGALRVGSGLVTIAAPPAALSVYASHLTAIMLHRTDDAEAFAEMLGDHRLNAAVLGPGQGLTERTRQFVDMALGAGKKCVLDADALTVFADKPADLFSRLHGGCVLTPHDGEFARLFTYDGSKLERVRQAAKQAGAVVLLKGADTVIAAPDGSAVINDNAPADLATAGSGDVLAGFIGGLLAQGVPAFEAAAMGAWLHGAAGLAAGPGLIAEDLPEVLPSILRQLREMPG